MQSFRISHRAPQDWEFSSMIRTPSLECASDVLNLSANHVLLNGFNDEDILERLTLLKSKPRELRAMRTGIQTAMAGWPRLDRMLGPIAKLLGPRGPSKGSFKPLSQEQLSKKSEKSRKVWKEWLDNRDAKAQDYGAADYEDYMHNML